MYEDLNRTINTFATMSNSLKEIILNAWDDRSLLKEDDVQQAIRDVIEKIDKGFLRCAELNEQKKWQVNDLVKKAVLLYFPIQKMKTIEVGPFEFHDKMLLKKDFSRHKCQEVIKHEYIFECIRKLLHWYRI